MQAGPGPSAVLRRFTVGTASPGFIQLDVCENPGRLLFDFFF
jgi:hypothetical protein